MFKMQAWEEEMMRLHDQLNRLRAQVLALEMRLVDEGDVSVIPHALAVQAEIVTCQRKIVENTKRLRQRAADISLTRSVA
jgi:hypothetical protein